MKKFLALIICCLPLCSCSDSKSAETVEITKPEETIVSESETTASAATVTTENTATEATETTATEAIENATEESELSQKKFELSKNSDLSALELVGYEIDEDGYYCVVDDNRKYAEDFDLYRKYFFGEWYREDWRGDNYLYIDDSEKDEFNSPCVWGFGGYGSIGDNVLFFERYGNAAVQLFWLDINQPDIMYYEVYDYYSLDKGVFGLNYYGDEAYKTRLYTKTKAAVNEPEENFLSIYRLYEISRDYGIDFDMLVYIDHDKESNNSDCKYFTHDAQYNFYPVYLVSKSDDKFVFKTKVGNQISGQPEIDTIYAIEKADGEWIRTVEFCE